MALSRLTQLWTSKPPEKLEDIASFIGREGLPIWRQERELLNAIVGGLSQFSFATVFVSGGGDDVNGDGGPLTPFQTIQPAIDAITDASASKPYRVDVGPGVFSGSFRLKPWVFIVGSGRVLTVLANPAANWISTEFAGAVSADCGILSCAIGTNMTIDFASVGSTGAGRFFLYDSNIDNVLFTVIGNNALNKTWWQDVGWVGVALSPSTCTISNIQFALNTVELFFLKLLVTNTAAYPVSGKLNGLYNAGNIEYSCNDTTNTLTVAVDAIQTISIPFTLTGDGLLIFSPGALYHTTAPDADRTLMFNAILAGGLRMVDEAINVLTVPVTVSASRTYTVDNANPRTRFTLVNSSAFTQTVTFPVIGSFLVQPGGAIQSIRVASFWEIITTYDPNHLYLPVLAVAPATPASGGVEYVMADGLHYLGSGGTDTVIAPP